MRALFCSIMSLFYVSAVLPMPANANEESSREITELGDNIYRFRDNKHFSIFIVGKSSVLLTDPINQDAAVWLRREIERRFGKRRIAYVIYSHNHWDHVSGGEAFADDGTQFIAHELAAGDLKRNQAPTRIPNVTFSDRLTLDFEGRTIELTYYGPNNGAGNISLYVPDAKFLFVVDWIVLKRLPWREMYHYDLDGMIASLREVLKLDFKLVSPGHSVTGTKADVADFLTYLTALRAGVLKGMNEGKSFEEVQATLRFPAYKGYAMYDEWLKLNIKGAWDQLARTSGRFGQDN